MEELGSFSRIWAKGSVGSSFTCGSGSKTCLNLLRSSVSCSRRVCSAAERHAFCSKEARRSDGTVLIIRRFHFDRMLTG